MTGEKASRPAGDLRDFTYKPLGRRRPVATPFDVLVFTRGENKLDQDKPLATSKSMGKGAIIGHLVVEGEEVGMPVIELEDSAAPTGKVQLQGSQVWWQLARPAVERAIEQTMPEVSPYNYAQNPSVQALVEQSNLVV